jgi:hypothetical protein
MIRRVAFVGTVLLSILSGRPGSAAEQASAVFTEADIKAMRTEHEDWLW